MKVQVMRRGGGYALGCDGYGKGEGLGNALCQLVPSQR